MPIYLTRVVAQQAGKVSENGLRVSFSFSTVLLIGCVIPQAVNPLKRTLAKISSRAAYCGVGRAAGNFDFQKSIWRFGITCGLRFQVEGLGFMFLGFVVHVLGVRV